VRDIDTAVVDSLKVLDPNRPIREADVRANRWGADGNEARPGSVYLKERAIRDLSFSIGSSPAD